MKSILQNTDLDPSLAANITHQRLLLLYVIRSNSR